MRIDSVAVNVCKRCGQYAPLCGASVGLWPTPTARSHLNFYKFANCAALRFVVDHGRRTLSDKINREEIHVA